MLIKVHEGIDETKWTKGETWLGISLDSVEQTIRDTLGTDKVITNARLCVAAHYTGALSMANIYVYAGWSTSTSSITHNWINGNQLSTSRQDFYSSYRLSDIFSNTYYPYTINKNGCSYYTIYLKTANATQRKHFIDDVYVDVEYTQLYNVSIGATAGGSVNHNGGTYAAGTTWSAAAYPTIGYKFSGWSNGSSIVSTANPYNFTVNSNVALTAVFNPITYNITYNANGGTGSVGASSANFGNNVSLASGGFSRQYAVVCNPNYDSKPNIVGYVDAAFNGWEDRGNIVAADGVEYSWTQFDAPFYANTQTDVYGVFGYHKYNLINHYINNGQYEGRAPISGGARGVYPAGATVNSLCTTEQATATLYAQWGAGYGYLPAAPTRPGYKFLGWVFQGMTFQPGDMIQVGSDLVFTGAWEQTAIRDVYGGNINATVYVGNSECKGVYVGNTLIYG